MSQKTIDFFGQEIPVPKKTNPMIRIYGQGPEGKRCKHCKHITCKEFGNTYYKCDLRRNTNGPATDHRINWPACGKFEPEK